MTRPSRVRRRWAQGKPVLATVAHFRDPQSAELIGLMGIDCLWIDLEHQAIGMGEFENMARAARVSDMDVMARPAKGEFMRMARLLEAGASVIMYPRCESAEEARQIVRHAKFPPLGERGYFSASPDNPYCLTRIEEYLPHDIVNWYFRRQSPRDLARLVPGARVRETVLGLSNAPGGTL